MRKSKARAINVADAKREFSELLGRVAYGGETVLITRRGRPMAKLVPVDLEPIAPQWGSRGWLSSDDPFFEIVDDIVSSRSRHKPRVSTQRRPARSGRR